MRRWPLGCLPELQRWRESGLQPVDLGQARFGNVTAHGCLLTVTRNALLGRRIVGMGLQRGDRDAHPLIERQRAQQAVYVRFALGAVQPDRSALAGGDVPLPQPD